MSHKPDWLDKQRQLSLNGLSWTLTQLEMRGYSVDYSHSKNLTLCIENSLDCQVLTSSRGSCTRESGGKEKVYPSWRWKVERITSKIGVVSLIAIDDLKLHHAYLIPSYVLAKKQYVHITSHPQTYSGIYSKYYGAWGIIPFLLAMPYVENKDRMVTV